MQSRFILFPSRHKRLHSHIAFCSQFSTDGFGPKQLDFWKARSPTSEEGPKPRVDPSPSFGKGPENMSILFSKFEGLSKAQAKRRFVNRETSEIFFVYYSNMYQ